MGTDASKPPHTVAAIREEFRRSPVLALVSAIAIGFFVGALLRCFERDRSARPAKSRRE